MAVLRWLLEKWEDFAWEHDNLAAALLLGCIGLAFGLLLFGFVALLLHFLPPDTQPNTWYELCHYAGRQVRCIEVVTPEVINGS